MKKINAFLVFPLMFLSAGLSQSTFLENSRWKLAVKKDGTIEALLFKDSNTQIEFF